MCFLRMYICLLVWGSLPRTVLFVPVWPVRMVHENWCHLVLYVINQTTNGIDFGWQHIKSQSPPPVAARRLLRPDVVPGDETEPSGLTMSVRVVNG